MKHEADDTLEMAWDPAVACTDLKVASQILTDRCLKLSAKWCAECWMGLPPEIVMDGNLESSTISDDLLPAIEINPAVQYSKTVLELGEYSHAAAILSETSLTNKAASVESMPPPLPDLTPKATFFRAYALYMAGERAKEEKLLELERYDENLLCLGETKLY